MTVLRDSRPDDRAVHDPEWGAKLTRARLESLVDYHPDGVFAVDLEGIFTAVNAEALLQSGGYEVGDLLGRHFVELLVADDQPEVLEAFAALLDRQSRTIEVRFHRADGTVGELEIIGLPIVVDDEVVEIFGIAEDITDRKRSQQDLADARAAAEAASHAKSAFLATMSHEIRTPLTCVLAAAEMLGDSGLSEQQQRLLTVMERSGERLLRLVDEILDFSRVEAGRADIACVPFDLKEVVDDTTVMLRTAIDDKGLAWSCVVDDAVPPRLHGDPRRIAQVLANLVDNATKFTREGGVELRVTHEGVHPDDPAGPVAVRFLVTDTGIGMTAAQQAVVFEMFRQGDSSVTREHGGTGLGLAISRHLVSLMGGELEVVSALGGGSAFSFVLPLPPA